MDCSRNIAASRKCPWVGAGITRIMPDRMSGATSGRAYLSIIVREAGSGSLTAVASNNAGKGNKTDQVLRYIAMNTQSIPCLFAQRPFFESRLCICPVHAA
jgi:hypothetical protein